MILYGILDPGPHQRVVVLLSKKESYVGLGKTSDPERLTFEIFDPRSSLVMEVENSRIAQKGFCLHYKDDYA